jgi:hypothetical protein
MTRLTFEKFSVVISHFLALPSSEQYRDVGAGECSRIKAADLFTGKAPHRASTGRLRCGGSPRPRHAEFLYPRGRPLKYKPYMQGIFTTLDVTIFRGVLAPLFFRNIWLKKAYRVSTLHRHDSLKRKGGRGSLRSPEHGTRTLLGTPTKGITVQRIRCATLTLLTHPRTSVSTLPVR